MTEEEKKDEEEKLKRKQIEALDKVEKHTRYAKPVGRLEVIRKILVEIKNKNSTYYIDIIIIIYEIIDEEIYKTAVTTLMKYINNILRHRNEEKYRKIKLSNEIFKQRVANVNGCMEFLEIIGFKKDETSEFLTMNEIDDVILNSAASLIENALSNPFFGVL